MSQAISTTMPLADAPAESTQVVVATDKQQLAAIRPQWIRLMQRVGEKSPEAMYDLFAGTIDVIGEGAVPHVAVFRDGSGETALIAARLMKRRLPCRFGYAKFHTPHLRCLSIMDGGILTDKSAAATAAVVNYLRQVLRRREIDLLVVEHLPVKHEAFEPLAVRASRGPAEIHRRLSLDGDTLEKLIKSSTSKHRAQRRKEERLLYKHFSDDVKLVQFSRPEQVETFIKGAAEIVRHTYQGALGVGLKDDALWQALIGTEAQRGRFRGFWLEGAGKPVAFQCGMMWGGVYKMLAIAYLPEFRDMSPGITLHMKVLEMMRAEGVEAVDYGFGDADYKRQLSTESWDEITLHLWGRTPKALVARILTGTCAAMTRWTQSAADKLGITAWLKRRWRTRLQKSTK